MMWMILFFILGLCLSLCSSSLDTAHAVKADICYGKLDGHHCHSIAGSRGACRLHVTCESEQAVAVHLCSPGRSFSPSSSACEPEDRSHRPSQASRTARWRTHLNSKGHRLLLLRPRREHRDTRERGIHAAGASDINSSGSRSIQSGVNNPDVHSSSAPPSPGQQQLNALLAFRSLIFDPYSSLTSWHVPSNASLLSSDPSFFCRWRGITCDRSHRITGIDTSGFSLTARPSRPDSIPPAFSLLTSLTSLNLAGVCFSSAATAGCLTALSGSLPSHLSALSSLQYLFLSNNRFSGPFPPCLSSLTALKRLDLSRNAFSGPLPSWLSRLSSLTSLALDFNLLNGSWPGAIGQLSKLQLLTAGHNAFSGPLPASLSALTSLNDFEVPANQFSGPPPAWLHAMAPFSFIELSNNSFRGPVPPSWGKLRASALLGQRMGLTGRLPRAVVEGMCEGGLGTLDLSHNALTGALSFSLSRCSSLSSLTLTNNSLTGSLATLFKGLRVSSSFFSTIDVSQNSLSGMLPRPLFRLPYINTIALSDNSFHGPVPAVDCRLHGLSYLGILSLHSNLLSGAISPSFLNNCTQLAQLHLASNNLTGPFPSAPLALLPSLQILNISFNSFSGPLPIPLSSCKQQLQVILAAGNHFTGPLPRSLTLCHVLFSLDLSSNPLSPHPIPPWISEIGSSVNGLSQVNLAATNLHGPLPDSLFSLPQLSSLNLSSNHLSGSLDGRISRLIYLQALDFSSNDLSGPLPPQIANLTAATALVLRNNSFSGAIPPILAPLLSSARLPFLSLLDLSLNSLSGAIPYGFSFSPPSLSLNLSHNRLSGPIPPGTVSLQPPSSLYDNPGLCGGGGNGTSYLDGNGASYPPCPSSSPPPLSAPAIAGICIAAVACLLLLALAAFLLYRHVAHPDSPWEGGKMMVFARLDFPLSVHHLLQATDHFSDKHCLGRGGFGAVYRASLQDGRSVAIKRLQVDGSQGEREFMAEVNSLAAISHRNLVELLAAYVARNGRERLLVYNLLQGGSLDKALEKGGGGGGGGDASDKERPWALGKWGVRKSVALDVARGLKYLHHDCKPGIIHRDIKPANVLLDESAQAYVADFGLAKEIDITKSHMSTSVFGTIGYLAPEYTRRGRCSFKSDVFAYGVVLLQLVSGRQPTDEEVGERGITRWVASNSLMEVVDSRMQVLKIENVEVYGALKLGMLCTERVPADRPSMAEVVFALENLADFSQGIIDFKVGKSE